MPRRKSPGRIPQQPRSVRIKSTSPTINWSVLEGRPMPEAQAPSPEPASRPRHAPVHVSTRTPTPPPPAPAKPSPSETPYGLFRPVRRAQWLGDLVGSLINFAQRHSNLLQPNPGATRRIRLPRPDKWGMILAIHEHTPPQNDTTLANLLPTLPPGSQRPMPVVTHHPSLNEDRRTNGLVFSLPISSPILKGEASRRAALPGLTRFDRNPRGPLYLPLLSIANVQCPDSRGLRVLRDGAQQAMTSALQGAEPKIILEATDVLRLPLYDEIEFVRERQRVRVPPPHHGAAPV
jgi:hypothetical protein